MFSAYVSHSYKMSMNCTAFFRRKQYSLPHPSYRYFRLHQDTNTTPQQQRAFFRICTNKCNLRKRCDSKRSSNCHAIQVTITKHFVSAHPKPLMHKTGCWAIKPKVSDTLSNEIHPTGYVLSSTNMYISGNFLLHEQQVPSCVTDERWLCSWLQYHAWLIIKPNATNRIRQFVSHRLRKCAVAPFMMTATIMNKEATMTNSTNFLILISRLLGLLRYQFSCKDTSYFHN